MRPPKEAGTNAKRPPPTPATGPLPDRRSSPHLPVLANAAVPKTPAEKVKLFHYDPAYAIKASVPRYTISGNPDETDVFAGQQYPQLVDLEIPDR